MARSLRSRRVTVRFSDAEMGVVERKAAATGLDRASYCRQTALGAPISARVNQAARVDLIRIGVNLNQLTRWANTHETMADLGDLLDVIRSKIREL